ncbi:hypothetical protein M2321_003759 [Rhodoblastus acidophilus]|uniref:hypothetical protein n=1 Tax=Rhodoblastus acidophilus TaxID=1074 RepID=UPI0018B0BB0A|nr:hypothetical protein [Rhodoblastus acidophilus]MCW2276155.1 hypothetical protein [Rhodoblastus acidophilus]
MTKSDAPIEFARASDLRISVDATNSRDERPRRAILGQRETIGQTAIHVFTANILGIGVSHRARPDTRGGD